jgi:hypothetical protein
MTTRLEPNIYYFPDLLKLTIHGFLLFIFYASIVDLFAEQNTMGGDTDHIYTRFIERRADIIRSNPLSGD